MTLETVKNYLDITWDDPSTNFKVQDMISRAESVLNEYAGRKIDFTDETTADAQLLLDCCLYMWNHAFEQFKINYAPELIMLRTERQAKEYADARAEIQKEDTDV